MRDKFLSMNTWSEATHRYVPNKGAPHDLSKLTREQVKAETSRVLSTHRLRRRQEITFTSFQELDSIETWATTNRRLLRSTKRFAT